MTYKQYLNQLTEEQRAEVMAKRAAYWAQFGYTLEELDGRVAKFKKEFQKVIKAIRDENGYGAWIKAIMTETQIEKHTATVNCGGEFSRDKKEATERANTVMADERFLALLEKYNATAHKELDRFGVVQIRLHY